MSIPGTNSSAPAASTIISATPATPAPSVNTRTDKAAQSSLSKSQKFFNRVRNSAVVKTLSKAFNWISDTSVIKSFSKLKNKITIFLVRKFPNLFSKKVSEKKTVEALPSTKDLATASPILNTDAQSLVVKATVDNLEPSSAQSTGPLNTTAELTITLTPLKQKA